MSTDSWIFKFSEALANFKNHYFIVDAPTDWLSESENQIRACMKDFVEFSDEDRDLLGEISVYPRFSLYTAAHLKNDAQLYESFKITQLRWSQDDEISQLLNHRLMSDTLWDMLSRCKKKHPDSHGFHVEILLQIDIRCIAARILKMLHESPLRKHLLAQTGSRAQSLLDLLQALLDFPDLGASIRSPFTSAIVKLSKNSGLYPTCLDLRGVKKLGHNAVDGGSFGDIWRGSLGGRAVAIKVMRVYDPSSISKILKAYAQEAVLWRRLIHPHVLPFYGAFHWPEEPSRVCLVSPWMAHGNIVQYTKDQSPQVDIYSLLLDVALGLHYLHSFHPPVIHGDLKGANILITSSFRACIADFGLAVLIHDSQVPLTPTSNGHQGSLRWQAPEVLNYDSSDREHVRKSLASDIYSFGCVFYEILDGKPPFIELGEFQAMTAIIKGHRPRRPHHKACTDAVWDLMEECWKMDPSMRPNARRVIQLLSLICKPMEPACNWDEEIISRLRSTMGDAPLLASSICHAAAVVDSAESRTPSIHSRVSHGSNTSPERGSIYSAGSVTSPERTSISSAGSVTSLDRDGMRAITKSDILIAILGPTGTGKSSFINTATGRASTKVGHGLESCTQGVVAISCEHPREPGRNIVFVDTPGFDDSDRADYDILRDIADWLAATYQGGMTLTGILLFHRISESRMRGTPLRNLSVFQELCGTKALQNVILTTTMWDELVEEKRIMHESQLRDQFWKPMMSHGCRMARYLSTSESAWSIIDQFDYTTRLPVQIQEEMVDRGVKLSQTSAYTVLTRWWEQVITKLREALRRQQASSNGGHGRGAKGSTRKERRLEVALHQQRKLDEMRSEPEGFPSEVPSAQVRSSNHWLQFKRDRTVKSSEQK